jgi:hypothetical protein
MATYTINPRTGASGFDIEITGADGVRQTILGFETESEANAWIERDKRRDTDKSGAQ